jgi:hypothetical protein
MVNPDDMSSPWMRVFVALILYFLPENLMQMRCRCRRFQADTGWFTVLP